MKKQWKIVREYEDYQISNYGEIKSFKSDKVNGRLLKLTRNKNGYCQLSLCMNGKPWRINIHRLVAEYFDPGWDPELEVNHDDEDKTNNKSDNLTMCTHEESQDFYFRKRGNRCKNKGVYNHKPTGKFLTKFQEDKKNWHIGLFNTEDEAYEAYLYAEKYGAVNARKKYKQRK